MAELFGLDIAQLVADGLEVAGSLQEGTLHRRASASTRDSDHLTRITHSAVSDYSFQGFMEIRTVQRDQTLISESVSVLTIIGASLESDVVPAVGDQASIGDFENLELKALLESDPAGAVYEFRVS